MVLVATTIESVYFKLLGAILFTVKVKLAVVLPLELIPVMVNTVCGKTTVGMPLIKPVDVFKLTPVGRAGVMLKLVIESLASARANLASASENTATLVHDFGVDKATKAKMLNKNIYLFRCKIIMVILAKPLFCFVTGTPQILVLRALAGITNHECTKQYKLTTLLFIRNVSGCIINL